MRLAIPALLSVAIVAIAALALALMSSQPSSQPTQHHTPQHFPSSLPDMVKAAVVGSTGSVGRATVHSLATHPAIAAVTAITRRPYFANTTTTPPTLQEHVVADLFSLQPADFRGADTVYCCLGTTRADAGGAEQFRHLDHDLIVSVAAKAKEAGVRRFHLVSSYGANADSWFLYTQSKGQTEQAVQALGFEQLGVWRPSFLDTATYPREQRKPRLGERLALPMFKLLRPVLGDRSASRHIAVEQVADAMVRDSLSGRQGEKLYDGSGAILNYLDEGKGEEQK